MSNIQTQPQTGIKALSNFLNSDSIKSKFAEVLGDKNKGAAFVSSVLSVVNSNGQLANADQNSIYTSCLMAAALDLPINPSIGHAWIVPFNNKQSDGTYKQMASFQISAKGLKQLAMRSGQFLTIHDSDVREGEIESINRLSGEIKFNWIQNETERLAKPIVGFVCYFKLLNGFESTFYMTKEEVTSHAKQYSMTFKKFGTGLWKDSFEKMASKTVIKLHLSKNAPLSVTMQKAIAADQSVIKNDGFTDTDTVDVEHTEYVDNQTDYTNHEDISDRKSKERVESHIENAKTLEELKQVESAIADEDVELYDKYKAKEKELKNAK